MQLFIKINVCERIPETCLEMQLCFSVKATQGFWVGYSMYDLYVRTVVGNYTDSNLPIPEKVLISAKH